jgi:hypothetical protein
MRKIVKEIVLYRFSELSEKAKDVARQKEAALFGYPASDEALNSIHALAIHFGGRMYGYEIDWFGCSYSSAKFDVPDDMEHDEIASRLAVLGDYNKETLHGNGECRLTGWCYDEDAIDGFRIAFMGGERDLGKLMQAAFRQWLKACQSDCEWQYGDEQFSETCDANGYWFTKDGAFYEADLDAMSDEQLADALNE